MLGGGRKNFLFPSKLIFVLSTVIDNCSMHIHKRSMSTAISLLGNRLANQAATMRHQGGK
jgi:hypothetical protein